MIILKELIIAEKPSLAKQIASALNISHKDKQGFYENESYIVISVFGHLLGLMNIKDYEGVDKLNWQEIKLPYIPEKFKYKLNENDGVKERFFVIKKLLENDNVSAIYNAGDSDREGQIIIDNILLVCNNKKPVFRLWLSDQTDETIISEIKLKRNNNDYTYLRNEGHARTYLDWLIGINMTIYLSNISGEFLNVGRVMIPIIEYIYNREKSINEFVSQKYFVINHDFIIDEKKYFSLTLEQKFKADTDKEKIDLILNDLNNSKIIVDSVEKNRMKKAPKKLFSKTSLQKHLIKNYKMDLEEIKKVQQELYELGYVTYPRTNTEYLSENEKDKVKSILAAFDNNDLCFKDNKNVFDNSKVEAHSAIIPTTRIPKNLTGNNELVYNDIKNRFFSNFTKEDCLVDKTTVTFKILKHSFKKTGESLVQHGFFKYEKSTLTNELPILNEGEEYTPNFKLLEKDTVPPKKITISSLLSYLENPFNKDNDEMDSEYYELIKEGVEIGTVATRDDIIKKCETYKYISLKNDVFSIEDKGNYLINIIKELNIDLSANTTIEFQKTIKNMKQKELSMKKIIDNTEQYLLKNIDLKANINARENEENTIGVCPVCNKSIKENKNSYSCSGYKEGCKFSIWKNNKFFEACGIKLTAKNASDLLSAGKTIVNAKSKKTGSKYKCYLIMNIEDSSIYPQFKMEFMEKKGNITRGKRK